MKSTLRQLLADPVNFGPLRVKVNESNSEDISSGSLSAEDGTIYPISNGIPRFVLTRDHGQLQTSESFGFKWKKRDTYDSPAAKQNAIAWYVEKYGFESITDWTKFFDGRKTILDIGCGSGFSSSLWLDSSAWTGSAMWVGVDISEAIDVAQERLGHIKNTHFIQADALQLPFPVGTFDTIFSEGVLHHTPSTRLALLSAARVLATNGEIQFYIYRRKSPVREFTDDYIREQLASLSDEEAWAAMRTLTHLGQVLAEARTEVELKEDIPLLGIKSGKQDIQRLVYWSFAKLYWNSMLSFEENVHINFDWYRPKYAHRQTTAEVKAWCDEAQLIITRYHEQESGFTVRAIKK